MSRDKFMSMFIGLYVGYTRIYRPIGQYFYLGSFISLSSIKSSLWTFEKLSSNTQMIHSVQFVGTGSSAASVNGSCDIK